MDYTAHQQLEFRRKFWKFFGAEINVSDPQDGQSVGLIKMKAWKLREDIRLYRDAGMQQELLRIGTRQIIDFGATYDVFDGTSDKQLFSLRRKGLKSTFVRDHWTVQHADGLESSVEETSGTLALLRRWIGLLPFGDIIELIFAFAPQKYEIRRTAPDGTVAVLGRLIHRKNPVIIKMSLELREGFTPAEAQLGVAVAALLSVIDAAKN